MEKEIVDIGYVYVMIVCWLYICNDCMLYGISFIYIYIIEEILKTIYLDFMFFILLLELKLSVIFIFRRGIHLCL